MSGHSKWSTIRRKKGKLDAQRGQLFTKLIKEITIAARQGGGDPDANARLRTAVANAKAANMPAQNIERAIKKGTGELPGTTYEEYTYEGYGPSGVAILVECLSDNKNRTTSEVRHIFSKYGGNLGQDGCVAWLFDQRGAITIPRSEASEEQVMEIAIEAGADDLDSEAEEFFWVYTPVTELNAVSSALEEAGLPIESRELVRQPQTTVMLGAEEARKLLRLMDALEEHDDVQKVHSNADISADAMEQIQSE
ncbi:MAG: YebC/PmpR family DNA-binding transcriptional regulator [Candidatus Eisenbacteria bacterium]|nr:YebC/PmpR family DNA-binding transcriptional regulator [Candidatus Eisenbacteria bacterium]